MNSKVTRFFGLIGAILAVPVVGGIYAEGYNQYMLSLGDAVSYQSGWHFVQVLK